MTHSDACSISDSQNATALDQTRQEYNLSWLSCRGWMDEEMIHRRMQIQQGEEPEENFEMLHYPL